MKNITCAILISLIFCVSISSPATASLIQGLYNTGVNNSGNALTASTVDPHYSITGGSAVVRTPHALYVTAPAGSAWIGPYSGNGSYSYSIRFNVIGDPNEASISGMWAVDNEGTIWLNGSYAGLSIEAASSSDYAPFASLHSFQIDNGFISGENVLEFRVTNFGATTGLLVTGLQPVPIPAAIWLLGAGLVGLIGIRRIKK